LRHTIARLHEAVGDYREAVASLEAVVVADPLDEAAHAGQMRLYALLGDRSHALRQFGYLRERLRQDLGVAPSPSSQQLYDTILARHSLDTAERPPTAGVRGTPAQAHNLPLPLTSLVGREREVAELRALLEPGTGNAERGMKAGGDHSAASTLDQSPRSAFPVPR
jgi:DNA-binding SARP family transcriptional activator